MAVRLPTVLPRTQKLPDREKFHKKIFGKFLVYLWTNFPSRCHFNRQLSPLWELGSATVPVATFGVSPNAHSPFSPVTALSSIFRNSSGPSPALSIILSSHLSKTTRHNPGKTHLPFQTCDIKKGLTVLQILREALPCKVMKGIKVYVAGYSRLRKWVPITQGFYYPDFISGAV